MTAHQQLRAAYLVSGLTMEEVGFRAGCTKNTVLRVCGPTPRNVRADVLMAVAQVLGLRAVYIQTSSADR